MAQIKFKADLYDWLWQEARKQDMGISKFVAQYLESKMKESKKDEVTDK